MKKIVVAISVAVLVCLGLTACCEHQYESKVTTEATCIAEGVMTFTCVNCEKSYTEAIPVSDTHQYVEKVTVAATCEKTGTLEKKCSLCDNTITEDIAATGDHSTRWGKCTTCGTIRTELKTKAEAIAEKYDEACDNIALCTAYISSASDSSYFTGTDSAAKYFKLAGQEYKKAADLCGDYPEFAAIKKELLNLANGISKTTLNGKTGTMNKYYDLKAMLDTLQNNTIKGMKNCAEIFTEWKAYE